MEYGMHSPLQTRAQHFVLTDRRDDLKFRKFLDAREKRIVAPVKELWKDLGGAISIDYVEAALRSGKIPADLKKTWEKRIREFVRDDIAPEWIGSIKASGDSIAEKVNRVQVKEYDYNETAKSVKAWVDKSGGTLIVDLTTAQYKSIHALLQNQIATGVTSPYVLAQRLKPMVGLTQREALAVARFLTSLTEEGVPASVINKKVTRYTDFLHKNRASRIARTELSNSYGFGQLDSIKQARDADWISDPEKSWMAGGADPCEICLENEAAGWIPIDAAFPSGDEHQTSHPHCECSVVFRARR